MPTDHLKMRQIITDHPAMIIYAILVNSDRKFFPIKGYLCIFLGSVEGLLLLFINEF